MLVGDIVDFDLTAAAEVTIVETDNSNVLAIQGLLVFDFDFIERDVHAVLVHEADHSFAVVEPGAEAHVSFLLKRGHGVFRENADGSGFSHQVAESGTELDWLADITVIIVFLVEHDASHFLSVGVFDYAFTSEDSGVVSRD